MPNIQRNYLTIIILLSVTLLGLFCLKQSRGDATPCELGLEDIPHTIGEWHGRDLSVSKLTYELLETEDLLMREYTNPRGEKVWVAIVYCAGNRSAFHPPEICYVGGGNELLDRSVERIEIPGSGESPYLIQANRLIMQDRIGKHISWHWFTAAGRITPGYLRQQCYIIWDELRRSRGGGALVRISTRVTGDDLKAADVRGKDFISQIIPVLKTQHIVK